MKDTIYRDDAIEAILNLNAENRVSWKDAVIDTISALPSSDDEAVKAVRDCRNCGYGKYNDHFDTWFCYNDCECKDWDLWESTKVAQREWIKTVDGNGWNDWYVLKCPFCGATIEDKHYHSWEYNFCPHCGERVKG